MRYQRCKSRRRYGNGPPPLELASSPGYRPPPCRHTRKHTYHHTRAWVEAGAVRSSEHLSKRRSADVRLGRFCTMLRETRLRLRPRGAAELKLRLFAPHALHAALGSGRRTWLQPPIHSSAPPFSVPSLRSLLSGCCGGQPPPGGPGMLRLQAVLLRLLRVLAGVCASFLSGQGGCCGRVILIPPSQTVSTHFIAFFYPSPCSSIA